MPISDHVIPVFLNTVCFQRFMAEYCTNGETNKKQNLFLLDGLRENPHRIDHNEKDGGCTFYPNALGSELVLKK